MSANISLFVPHAGCPQRCSFCNQNSITGQIKELEPKTASETVAGALNRMGDKAKTAQVAFFGGSFTAIEQNYMIALLESVQPYIGENKFSGIRISTRPDAIDENVLEILKKYNVTAIELGAQSMNDEVLSKNLRGHTSADTKKSAMLIREYGFELGLQMMTGMYGSNDETDLETAREVATLNPDTVRIYPTVVLPDTLLARLFESGEYVPPTLENAVSLCAELLMFFENRRIKVIKLGLHSSKEVDENRMAGPFHPAFRELCEGRVFLAKVMGQLDENDKNNSVIIKVNPSCISKMTGQKRSNLRMLRTRTKSCIIKGDESVSGFDVKIERIQM